MPRVKHVKKARKDNPVCAKGESYYWWKFRYGGKHYSLTYPKASRLTQSVYLSVIYSCQEQWEELTDPSSLEAYIMGGIKVVACLREVADSMESIKDELFELVDQYEESASNMEEYFSGAERIDQLRDAGMECETTCDEIDTMVDEVRSTADEIDTLEVEDGDDDLDDFHSDIQDLLDALSFQEPNFEFHQL